MILLNKEKFDNVCYIFNSRVTGPGSIGDSFKAEISNLQNQLTQSTQALQEKIALLQGREEYYESDMSTAYDERPASYNDRAGGYDSWSVFLL